VNGVGITVLGNFIMAGGDWDEMKNNYARAWKEGNFKWLNIDITPIYKAFGGETPRHKYFNVIGHMMDPFKAIFHTDRFIQGKASVVGKLGTDFVFGRDWAGRRYTTLGELLRDKKLVKYGPAKPYDKAATFWEWLPSYALSQIIGTEPVQLQNLIGWTTGENEGFDSITNSLGLGITSTHEGKGQRSPFSIRGGEPTSRTEIK
jgi:hypothetical protein